MNTDAKSVTHLLSRKQHLVMFFFFHFAFCEIFGGHHYAEVEHSYYHLLSFLSHKEPYFLREHSDPQ